MSAPMLPGDFLDGLAVLFPAAGFLLLTVWLRAVRASDRWRAREIERNKDRITELEQQLSAADAAGALAVHRANQWHTAWRLECARSLGLDADTEARAN